MQDVSAYVAEFRRAAKKAQDDLVSLPAHHGHARAVALVQAETHWQGVMADVAEIVAWLRDQQRHKGAF